MRTITCLIGSSGIGSLLRRKSTIALLYPKKVQYPARHIPTVAQLLRISWGCDVAQTHIADAACSELRPKALVHAPRKGQNVYQKRRFGERLDSWKNWPALFFAVT